MQIGQKIDLSVCMENLFNFNDVKLLEIKTFKVL